MLFPVVSCGSIRNSLPLILSGLFGHIFCCELNETSASLIETSANMNDKEDATSDCRIDKPRRSTRSVT